jgi:ABC-type nitrate/sulfonate/bicarbonate transport system substrate-binding protein
MRFTSRGYIAHFLFLILLCGLTSCGPRLQSVILQREWTANAEFAGDVWASDISQNHGLKLEVREGSEIIDPIKVVRSGGAHFGVASADRILRENESGSDLVILAAATYKSPVVFLTHPVQKIRTPADFRGRTVGIQAGTNTELVFKSLLLEQHMNPTQMKVVESGWGTTNFETGAIDVLAAFDYDEPVQLEIKSVPIEVIRPEAYGVHFVGTVYFTRRSLLTENPTLVQSFMDSLVEGWRHALDQPSEAITRISSHFKEVDKPKEMKSLMKGREYFAGEKGHLLYASQERWIQMSNSLVAQHLLRSFVFDANIDYRFLEAALNKGASK